MYRLVNILRYELKKTPAWRFLDHPLVKEGYGEYLT